MEEFWKFIFGQGMLPEPKDDAAQIKRAADARMRSVQEKANGGLDILRAEQAENLATHERRMTSMARLNAYLDEVEAERKAAPRGWKVKRGENWSEASAPMQPEPKNWLNGPAPARKPILPPSYYTERGLSVPADAHELPSEMADAGRQAQGGPR
jgi:hypothetical protein